MKSNIYDVNVFDYYKCGHSVVFKIKITDINRKESWYISKSYKEFVQVDDFFRLRYPSIPELPYEGWWWQHNDQFYKYQLEELQAYMDSILKSDPGIENMVLKYFLDLHLIIGDNIENEIVGYEVSDTNILEYMKTNLLDLSHPIERTLSPMEQRARESAYKCYFEENAILSISVDCNKQISGFLSRMRISLPNTITKDLTNIQLKSKIDELTNEASTDTGK
ncbi:hypothetical protein cand_022860 [Cryptosporidium andersoni]|uniref:PX domain-containing protein n=1 Tax=Cryptosporidium andersoni TaxID=117008 RepID=A0A1J4MSA3_9CRYT|nr:hypothetical protein cand_022860 [Cryptosporidium andersoni]